MEGLTPIVTLLIALSVTSERIVEIIKNMFPFLAQQQPKAADESRRKLILQLLAFAAGCTATWLGLPVVDATLPPSVAANAHHGPVIVALGALASGGSGFWNTILTYMLNIKNLKRAEATQVEQQQAAVGLRPLPQPADALLIP
jgi:uncharacterized membrane-anchored protein